MNCSQSNIEVIDETLADALGRTINDVVYVKFPYDKGVLSINTWYELPYDVERINIQSIDSSTSTNIAYKIGARIIIANKGEVCVTVNDGTDIADFIIGNEESAVFVPEGIWSNITTDKESVIVTLFSTADSDLNAITNIKDYIAWKFQ